MHGGLRRARSRVLAQARGGGHQPRDDAAAQRRCRVRPDRSRRRRAPRSPPPARAARRRRSKDDGRISPTIVAEAKKEGHLNTIALPPDWANYGEMISTFQKKYGIKITNDNPDGSSAEENQAISSLKGDSRAPDVVDVGVAFAIAGANAGPVREVLPRTTTTIPRAMKDTRGFWTGDYWGAISIGYNQNLVCTRRRRGKDLLKPEYKGKVALNGSPLTSNSAVSGVIAAALGERRLARQRPAGDRLLRQAEEGRQLHPGADDPADGRLGPDADLDRLGLQQPRLHQGVPGGEWGFTIPSDGVYGGYYCQAINATAPHPWAARLWEEFLYSDQGQIIWLKGARTRRGSTTSSPEGHPAVADRGAAVGRDLRQGEVREHRPADRRRRR